LLFLDEKGSVGATQRLLSTTASTAIQDYVAGHHERKKTLADYLGYATREPASPRLHDEAFFMAPPYDLRRTGSKPLAVIFETVDCSPCDELHREGFRRDEVRALLKEFDVARFSLGARTQLTTPAGKVTTAQAWARELGVTYTPTIVFFETTGAEVFRMDAYLRPFHLASSLDYVASGGYRVEPSFQRFIQARAERSRARGERVDLWK
jgi:thioredoxin-related protein